MLKLLKFEFRRIFQSVFFWIVTGFSVLWPLLTALAYKLLLAFAFNLEKGETFADIGLPESMLTILTWNVGAAFITELPKFVALFTCLHIGRDYTDGIIRNKITAGHSRLSIYFSYMITQLCASIFFCIVYIGASMLSLLITGTGVDLNGGELLGRFAAAIVVFLVMTVTFTVLSVIFRKRAAPIIFCIFIALTSNAAATVIGWYRTPPKAADIYIEKRHSYFVEQVKEGNVDKNTVKYLEKEYDKSSLLGLGFGWQVFYPVYAVSPFGFESDYQVGGLSTVTSLISDYSEEIDYSEDLLSKDMSIYSVGSYYDWDDQYSGTSSFGQDTFKREKAMHMPYTTLNWIYIGKSAAWMAVIGAWGYVIFRKKNLF